MLERIRAGYGAWNEGDLDKTLEFLRRTSSGTPQRLVPGHEARLLRPRRLPRVLEHLHEPWEDVHVEIESYAREGEVAILRIRFHGTSKASGVTVDLPWFQAIVIEDDLVVRSALDRMSATPSRRSTSGTASPSSSPRDGARRSAPRRNSPVVREPR